MFVEAIRRLHAEGLHDADIARRLGSDRATVHAVRYARLKLPANAVAVQQAHRQALRTQYARLGIESAGQLRSLAHSRYAVENGWPADLRPRAVQILNLLAEASDADAAEQADPLSRPCPKCHAPAGQKCRDYRKRNKALCPQRDPRSKKYQPPKEQA